MKKEDISIELLSPF